MGWNNSHLNLLVQVGNNRFNREYVFLPFVVMNDTTLSVEWDFWMAINQIARGTGKSKRAILWKMLLAYIHAEDTQTILRLEGMDVEALLRSIEESAEEALTIQEAA